MASEAAIGYPPNVPNRTGQDWPERCPKGQYDRPGPRVFHKGDGVRGRPMASRTDRRRAVLGLGASSSNGPKGLTRAQYNRMVVSMQIAPPDFDRMFGALADATRRDLVRRAIDGEEGVAELAGHYPMSFAAVQKHVAILERAGLVTKERIGRRKVVRTNLEGLRVARRLLDQYEELWRGRIGRMTALITYSEEPDR
jgi:DNA-binding transcriptional ArsR family regulator